MLTAAFLGVGVSLASMLYYSAGIFVRPLEEEFGWTRAEIGLSILISTILVAVLSPAAGRLIDRFGLRTVATVSLFLYALGLFALSQMTGSLALYLSIYIYCAVTGVASTPIAFTRAVNGWFDRNRGLALGIALSGNGIASFLLLRFLTPFVAEHGWRLGYMVLGAIVVLGVPLVWAWIRDDPKELEVGTAGSARPVLAGVTFREAWRTYNFWAMGAAFFLIALGVSGLIPSFIPLLQDAGLPPEVAGGYGALIGLSVMVGRLVTGFLIDRIFAPHVTAVIFTLVAAGCLSLLWGGIAMAPLAAIALGLAMGAEVDLIGFYVARYFGLYSYGVIYGVQYGLFALAAGVSPVLAGYIHDTFGSYDWALRVAVVLLVISVGLVLTLSRFPKFEMPDSSTSS